ncbi:hypothetical protein [Saccharibacillus alkalitolerans]|uniref:Uncharacterized protein n=1 Tax=Saccharibacillus alkalitolerans TaxID=2705290 RepID=A0ABX0F7U8_9BACL|nr:hypothetical protein [Saccharibacillus alkalitolerans]NGZ74097.1 hypothetical protein [Saccharibacillus alkalitolerans]
MRQKSNNHNLTRSGSWSPTKARKVHMHARPGKAKFSQPVQHKSKLLYQQPAEYKVPGFLKDLLEAK